MVVQRGQTHYHVPNEVELMKYTIKWTQPYSLDYRSQMPYNTQEQVVEAILAVSPMLEALEVINRIRQL